MERPGSTGDSPDLSCHDSEVGGRTPCQSRAWAALASLCWTESFTEGCSDMLGSQGRGRCAQSLK
eukprot:15038161-Alexandrium_andersonii.AAC.1